MELLEAKTIFKIQDRYGQAELDAFYGFEKNLLLQRLSDEASAEELTEAQEALARLERAYSVLSCELTSPTPVVEEDIPAPEKKPVVNPALFGIFIGLLLAAGIYLFLQNPPAPSQPRNEAAPEPAPSASETEPQGERESSYNISSDNYKLDKAPQEAAMLRALKKAKAAENQWRQLAQGHAVQLPKNIRSLMEDGQVFRQSSRYSKAQIAFEEYTRTLTEHTRRYASYQSTFNRFDTLKKRWDALAAQNNFRFGDESRYIQQFQTIKQELQQGKFPSYSRATLDQTCFIYETTIQRGEALARQHQEYVTLRKQWEKHILKSRYYTLTPATEELLQIADNKPYYVENFEYLQTQVYPRLINHFKQHL